jgi:hypothetical protein
LEDFPSPLQDLPALDATPGLLSDEEWKEILKDMDVDFSAWDTFNAGGNPTFTDIFSTNMPPPQI